MRSAQRPGVASETNPPRLSGRQAALAAYYELTSEGGLGDAHHPPGPKRRRLEPLDLEELGNLGEENECSEAVAPDMIKRRHAQQRVRNLHDRPPATGNSSALGKRPHASGDHAERQRRLRELLDCPICLKPVSSPQFLHCCGGCVCGLCLHSCRMCPLCREKRPSHSDHHFAQNIRQILQETGCTLELGGMMTNATGTAEGEFKDGKLYGQCKVITPQKDICEGEFKDNKLCGQGTITLSDGSVFTGEYIRGELNGQGKVTFAGKRTYSGDVLEGEFKNHKLNGQGKIVRNSGDVLEGEFKDNMLNGQGKIVRSIGYVLEGEFKDGLQHGRGKVTITGKHGYVLESEFKDGLQHGRGKVVHSSGDVHEGEFKDNKLCGQGTNTLADGTVLEGCFKDGEFHRGVSESAFHC